MCKLEFEPQPLHCIARVLSTKSHCPMSLSNFLRRKATHSPVVKKYHKGLSPFPGLYPHCFRHFPRKCVHSLGLFSILWLCNGSPHNSVPENNHLLCSWILQVKRLDQAWHSIMASTHDVRSIRQKAKGRGPWECTSFTRLWPMLAAGFDLSCG